MVMLAEEMYTKDIFIKSLKGLTWILQEADSRLVQSLKQKLEIPELLATILVNRGITDEISAKRYLNPTIKELLPDPYGLKDMDLAVDRIVKAILNKEKITVFGDYDVDGATSSALITRFFREIDVNVEIYIPNRILEGYGLNLEALKSIKDKGTSLVISVDCGIVSFDPIKGAKEYGLDVIVIDHHLSTDTIPEADAVVNPNRFDDTFTPKGLAAVGVCFLVLVALRSKLRKDGFFEKRREPDLLKALDIVALGTVCDVMPLVGLNRAFVSHGLKQIAHRQNLGLSTLANAARLDAKPESYHLGFVLGPRINAGGRVGEGNLGAELLSTLDPMRAYEIANRLEELNRERRAVEAIILDEVLELIEKSKLYTQPMILVKGENWHQGILGILASRIKERYNKPVAVVSMINGLGKGSGRSIVGVDLGTLLANAKAQGLLVHGGGHAMAGGFTVEDSKFEAFKDFAFKALGNTDLLTEKSKECYVDSAIAVTAVCGKTLRLCQQAAPFGNGNMAPKFVIVGARIANVIVVGRVHLMVILNDPFIDKKASNTIKCVFFKALESDYGPQLMKSIGKTANFIGHLQHNINDENKADFIIEDICDLK